MHRGLLGRVFSESECTEVLGEQRAPREDLPSGQQRALLFVGPRTQDKRRAAYHVSEGLQASNQANHLLSKMFLFQGYKM